MMKTNTNRKTIPRDLRALYNYGIEFYELEYLLSLRKRQEISKKWQHR